MEIAQTYYTLCCYTYFSSSLCSKECTLHTVQSTAHTSTLLHFTTLLHCTALHYTSRWTLGHQIGKGGPVSSEVTHSAVRWTVRLPEDQTLDTLVDQVHYTRQTCHWRCLFLPLLACGTTTALSLPHTLSLYTYVYTHYKYIS